MKQFVKLQIILLLFCFSVSCDFRLNNLAFDSEQWKSSDLRTRGRIFKDLKKSKILEGKTKPEVENLLGIPAFENQDNWIYKIDLGYRFGNTVWTYNLNVRFNEKKTNS